MSVTIGVFPKTVETKNGWQKMLKGMPGGDTKRKAYNYLTAAYGIKCLKDIGIIGPRGGYLDGPGDAACIATYYNQMKGILK